MLTRAYFPTVFRTTPRTWDPFRELRQIQQQMDQLFDQAYYPRVTEYPALNVYTSEDEILVEAELPGFGAEDLDISVVQNTLTLRGTRKPVELKSGESYHRRERWTGQFVRTVELPYEVESDKVEAECRRGLLTIRMPRAEAHRPRKIAVKAS
ncbi:MAG: Hsp20/alpha crystallin family protein [Candidatus Latescibacterota bacterium]